MSSMVVVPIDLRTKRQARGESQETFGQLLGVTRQQVHKYESGRFNIPTDKACESAILLDGITLEYKGIELELRPKKANRRMLPDVVDGATPVDSAINVAKELQDVQRHMESLIEHATAIRNGRCDGKAWVTTGVKEVAELVAVGKRYLHTSRDHFPDEWAQGMALALAELSDVYGVVGVEIGDSAERRKSA